MWLAPITPSNKDQLFNNKVQKTTTLRKASNNRFSTKMRLAWFNQAINMNPKNDRLFSRSKNKSNAPKNIKKPKPKTQISTNKRKSYVSVAGLTCRMAVHRHSWPRRQMRGCAKIATIALRNATSSLFFSLQPRMLSLSLSTCGLPFLLILESEPICAAEEYFLQRWQALRTSSSHEILWCEPPSDLSLNAAPCCCDHSSVIFFKWKSEGKLMITKCRCKPKTHSGVRLPTWDWWPDLSVFLLTVKFRDEMWVSCLLGPKTQCKWESKILTLQKI